MSGSNQLQRRLGLPFALAVTCGMVVGSGIMRTPGEIADLVPVMWIAMGLWVLGGVYVLLMANVAAELTAALPKAGGYYVPVQAAFGNGAGLLAGWATWLSFASAGAALSLACADFLGTIVPIVAANKIAVALGFLAAVTGLNWLGVREGRFVQIFGTALKIGLLLAIVVAALVLAPEVAPAAASLDRVEMIGWLGLVTAFQLVLGAYGGWDGSIFFAEEDTNPGRNIPRALFRSAFIVMAVYLAVNLALFSVLDIATLRTSELPFALVIEALFGPTGNLVVALLATFMALITLNALLMTAPRILFSMARDGLFLKAATRVNAGGTPWVALLMGSLVAAPLIVSGGYVFVFKIQTAFVILAAVLYCAAIFRLRRMQPDLARPFRAIGYPLLPAIVLIVNTAMLIAVLIADPAGAVWIVGLSAIAVPVGMMMGRRPDRTST